MHKQRTGRRRSRIRCLLAITAATALAFALAPGASLGDDSPTAGGGGGYWTWPGAAVLSVATAEPGSGYVRSEPYRIDCPLECTRAYDIGSVVVLTATPTTGFVFTGWSGDLCSGNNNPCVATITADAKLTANFSGSYKQ